MFYSKILFFLSFPSGKILCEILLGIDCIHSDAQGSLLCWNGGCTFIASMSGGRGYEMMEGYSSFYSWVTKARYEWLAKGWHTPNEHDETQPKALSLWW